MDKRSKCACLMVLFIFSACMAAWVIHPPLLPAKETITWVVMPYFPPFHIQEGVFKGEGISDELIKLYQEELPGYDHRNVSMNLARYLHEAKKGENVCYPLLLKTAEREKLLHFSIPVAPRYPHVVLTRNENIKYFQHADSVSLKMLFNNRSLNAIIEKERSYGTHLDPIIGKVGDYENISIRVHKSENLFKMVMNNRSDANYMIETIVGAVYLEQKYSAQDLFINIPIIEEAYSGFGYCTCSKTEWGDEIVMKINGILLKKRGTRRYRGILERWVDEKNIKKFRKYYDDVLMKTPGLK